MFVRCSRCIPDQNLSLVVELQANSAEDSDDPTQLFSIGWTKIDLFDISNRLLSGRYQLNLLNHVKCKFSLLFDTYLFQC